MFGWRKREVGFEWRKYVRTTVLHRRAQRRERIVQVRRSLAARAADAARWSWNAIANSCRWVWAALVSGGRWLAETARNFAVRSARAVWAAVVAVAAWFAARLPGVVTALGSGLRRAWLAVARVLGAGTSAIRARFPAISLPAPVKKGWQAATARLPALPAPAWRTLGFGLAVVLVVVSGFGLIRSGSGLASLVDMPFLGSKPIVGRASVVSGNIIHVGGTPVRLYGIDAPETAQRCRTSRNRSWQCGVQARTALARLVGSGEVRCERQGSDGAGRVVARCRVRDSDLGARMVELGHALTTKGDPAGYGSRAETAKKARRALWKGSLETPQAFRDRSWDTAKQQAPKGCPIKGNVTSRGKHYVMPWSRGYSRVRIQERRGERWFCSEQEAIAAGWVLTDRS
ncbi:MAG: thermonuclease family protein [Hyphomicrobiaceae bacterium]